MGVCVGGVILFFVVFSLRCPAWLREDLRSSSRNLCAACGPATTRRRRPLPLPFREGFRVGGGVGGGGGLQLVLWASSLERARQFVKAFGESGGDLHVA